MDEIFIRERALIGDAAFEKLKNSAVAVFGLGGVGSYVCEALARAGIGKLLLCDDDVIAVHNGNRQLFALNSTVGRKKAEVAAERMRDINPDIKLDVRAERYEASTEADFNLAEYNYVADCIDSVTSKILLAVRCEKERVPLISCMGTGNKLLGDFKIADIYSTNICPLAKVMRKELKARGVKKLKVVYSEEPVYFPVCAVPSNKRQTPASVSFVPPLAGIKMAGEIVRDIIGDDMRK